MPRSPTLTPARHTISYQLSEILESRGLTDYALAKLCGINRAQLHRFRKGQRDLTLATLDKLAAVLGLRLVEVARPARKPSLKPKQATAAPLPALATPEDDSGYPTWMEATP